MLCGSEMLVLFSKACLCFKCVLRVEVTPCGWKAVLGSQDFQMIQRYVRGHSLTNILHAYTMQILISEVRLLPWASWCIRVTFGSIWEARPDTCLKLKTRPLWARLRHDSFPKYPHVLFSSFACSLLLIYIRENGPALEAIYSLSHYPPILPLSYSEDRFISNPEPFRGIRAHKI